MEEPLKLPPILLKILFIVFFTLNYHKCSEQNKFTRENRTKSKDFILRLDKLDAYLYQKSLIVLLKVCFMNEIFKFLIYLTIKFIFTFSKKHAKIPFCKILCLQKVIDKKLRQRLEHCCENCRTPNKLYSTIVFQVVTTIVSSSTAHHKK